MRQPGCHAANEPYTAALQWAGRELRRYRGEWCAQTGDHRVWRSVTWLGLVDTHAALDALHAERAPANPAVCGGQLDMFQQQKEPAT